MTGQFYMSMDCGECGEEMLIGPCLTTIERNGMPVIPFDMAAQETFTCDCGTTWITGDFDVIDEGEL